MNGESFLEIYRQGLKSALEDLTNRQEEILSEIEAEKGLRNIKITINIDTGDIVTYQIDKDYVPTYYHPKKENEQS